MSAHTACLAATRAALGLSGWLRGGPGSACWPVESCSPAPKTEPETGQSCSLGRTPHQQRPPRPSSCTSLVSPPRPWGSCRSTSPRTSPSPSRPAWPSGTHRRSPVRPLPPAAPSYMCPGHSLAQRALRADTPAGCRSLASAPPCTSQPPSLCADPWHLLTTARSSLALSPAARVPSGSACATRCLTCGSGSVRRISCTTTRVHEVSFTNCSLAPAAAPRRSHPPAASPREVLHPHTPHRASLQLGCRPLGPTAISKTLRLRCSVSPYAPWLCRGVPISGRCLPLR